MIRSDDESSVSRAITALRSGAIYADYAPPAIADLIETLWREKIGLRSEISEMEQVYITSKTHAALRTEYARGFRDAQEQLARRCPMEEALIYSFGPDYAAASEGARYVG